MNDPSFSGDIMRIRVVEYMGKYDVDYAEDITEEELLKVLRKYGELYFDRHSVNKDDWEKLLSFSFCKKGSPLYIVCKI